MNFSKVLLKFFGECSWSCGKTYESMKWNDTETTKPTKEYLEGLWNDVLIDEMRKERNKLLKESAFRVLPDSPNTNKEAWGTYRQQLRDFPADWTEGTPFPSPPE